MMTRRKKILHDRQGIPRSTEIYVRNPFSTNTAIVLCCAPFLILASFPAAANLLRFASQQEEKSSLPKKKGSNQHLPKKIKERVSLPLFFESEKPRGVCDVCVCVCVCVCEDNAAIPFDKLAASTFLHYVRKQRSPSTQSTNRVSPGFSL